MRRLALVVGLVVAGCGSSSNMKPAASGSGGGAANAGAGGGGSSGGPVSPGTGGVVVPAVDAAGSGGAEGATDGPSNVDAAPADGAGTAASCGAGALICEDFEGYADGAADLSPRWTVYQSSGTVKVDGTKPHGGARSLHVTTQAGLRHYADIIKQTQDGTAVVPNVHYGRVMVWVSEIPGQSHWSITHAGGPAANQKTVMAKYAEGGMFGKLLAGYSVRQRPMAPDGTFLLRGGGPENGDPGTMADCSKAAKTETLQTKTWVCWEWKFDATNNETDLWLDGQPQTEVDVLGRGTACVGGANPVWQGPTAFTKLIVGWEQYQDAPAQEVWLDDLVIAPERVGCP